MMDSVIACPPLRVPPGQPSPDIGQPIPVHAAIFLKSAPTRLIVVLALSAPGIDLPVIRVLVNLSPDDLAFFTLRTSLPFRSGLGHANVLVSPRTTAAIASSSFRSS